MSQPFPPQPDQPPAPQPAPRKKRRWPWVAGGVFVVVVIAAIVGGQGSGSTSNTAAATTAATATEQAAAAPTVTVPCDGCTPEDQIPQDCISGCTSSTTAAPDVPASDTIVYTITGHRSSDITYIVPGSFQESQVTDTTKLPWSKTFTVDSGQYSSLIISAQNAGGGTIGCSISVDGQVVASNSSTGEYAIVECQGG
jgi:hypothetical protein